MAAILIVDDEHCLRVTLSEFLRRDGHTVEALPNAREALAVLGQGTWEIVLTDVVLPGISGIELLHMIREERPGIQVIMMTGMPTVDTAAEAVRAGAFDYLTKPITCSAILRVVRNAARVKALSDERELLAAERRAHQENLERANRRLEAATRHKSEFLANMSHELRTPLNGILGFAHLLLDQGEGLPRERRERYLRNIHKCGEHLLQLINDILDLSKVEAGKIELRLQPFAVSGILEEILVIVRGLANRKSVRLEIALAPDLPPLTADPVRFKQICFNLLSNAVKFTPAGGRVTLTARRIADGGSRTADPAAADRTLQSTRGDVVEIAVADTGAGIRPEDLDKLFGEFVQLDTTRAQHHEGTGLGLALTRRLVELHGGTIRAASPGAGLGSTFTVRLPLTGGVS
jgi:signal transduction histidine kinase